MVMSWYIPFVGSGWNYSKPNYYKKQYHESNQYYNNKQSYEPKQYHKSNDVKVEKVFATYTKEDLQKENDLAKKIMVCKSIIHTNSFEILEPSNRWFLVATYKAYFVELQKKHEALVEKAFSRSLTNKEVQTLEEDISKHLEVDEAHLSSCVHNLLRGLAPPKMLTDEVPLLVKDCIKECDIPLSCSEETADEISAQIEHYNSEFASTKDELLTLIIKKETAEYEKTQRTDSSSKEDKLKFLSAYRIYRRAIAPQIKAERPNLTGKERQAIIRDKWRQLDSKKKYIYVLRSRWDQERARFRQKTLEFKTQLALFAQETASVNKGSKTANDSYQFGK